MSNPIEQTFPLGQQWPTIDPFLFCAHHNDKYPAGTADLGPDPALLAGRHMGSDFSGQDGWSMYHGSVIPGFPQHPHRGFETVTLVRAGLIDHSDSLGAIARFGEGDVQWVTAGSGIVHSEMFPLLRNDAPNHAELFQIWLNLPAANKMASPHFTMLWSEDIPSVESVDASGKTTTIVMVAGSMGEVAAPESPPESWASQADSDVAIWLVTMEPGASWDLPAAAGNNTVRVLYPFEGPSISVDGTPIDTGFGAVVRCTSDVTLTAADARGGNSEPLQFLVLQGRPIGEPVARYGPFVMTTRQEIEQAFDDYRATQFGGWPWSADGPSHGTEAVRFAKFPDGRIEQPSSIV